MRAESCPEAELFPVLKEIPQNPKVIDFKKLLSIWYLLLLLPFNPCAYICGVSITFSPFKFFFLFRANLWDVPMEMTGEMEGEWVPRNMPNPQCGFVHPSCISFFYPCGSHVTQIRRLRKEFKFYTVFLKMQSECALTGKGSQEQWRLELSRTWRELSFHFSTVSCLSGVDLTKLEPGSCTWLLVQGWQHRAQHLLSIVFTQLLARCCSPSWAPSWL